MSYIHFKQTDREWKNIKYPKASSNYTIGNAGQGPTCVAILVSDLIPGITPELVAGWLSKNGFGTMGTAWCGITESLKHYRYADTKRYSDNNCYGKKDTMAELTWRNAMLNGCIGILNLGKSKWTKTGTYVAVLKAKFDNGKEKYYFVDPESEERSGWIEWNEVQGLVKNFWTCTPREMLDVDGQWGSETTTALQKVLGTDPDGIISEQKDKYQEYVPAGSERTFSWIKHPAEESRVIKKLQHILEVTEDGTFGPETIKALQRKFNLEETGICDLITVKALQKWINQKIKEEEEEFGS